MTEQGRNHSYSKSEALRETKNVIPNGIPGHFNPMLQVPAGTYPIVDAENAGMWMAMNILITCALMVL